MKEETNSFLEGSVTLSLMRFAVPVLAALVLQPLHCWYVWYIICM